MAQVNFDNAVIENYQDLQNCFASPYLGFPGSLNNGNWGYGLIFRTTNLQENISITSKLLCFVTNVTENGFKVVYDGAFNRSGNEFYIGNSSYRLWKVSNVVFDANDTFHFQIDVNFDYD